MDILDKVKKWVATLTGSGEVGGFQAPDRQTLADQYLKETQKERALAEERGRMQREAMRERAQREEAERLKKEIPVQTEEKEDGEAA